MSSSLSKSRSLVWAVWIVASLFYAYQYILRVMPNIMLDDIMHHFMIDAAMFGQFSGIYYIGYSLLHLPVGILLDRFGPKKIMSGCILLTVIGTLPLIFADLWIYPVLGRFLIGLGSSAAILGVFKIIRMSFDEKRFARMLSFSVMIGLIGAIYGGGPVSSMCNALGSQTVVAIFAAAGLLLALVTYLIVPNIQSESKSSVISDIKEVLTNSNVVQLCIFSGLMIGPLEGFADVWATAFLKGVYHLDTTLAASLPSLIFVGMCFGSPIISLVAEKTGSYLGTIIGAALIMAFCFFLVIGAKIHSHLISMNFILIGICCAYQIIAVAKVTTYVRSEVAGLTTAVANMIIMIFGYAFHSIIGTMVQAMGGPSSTRGLLYGVAVIPIALCLGAAGYFHLFLKERKVALQRSE
jgi:predicted MFS family arabinose efflux permease